MFDRVLNMPLDYLSCFVMVPKRDTLKCLALLNWLQYSLIFSLLWSHTWKHKIQANERLTKIKEKWSIIQFDVSDLSFIFVIPMSQKIHEEKWHVLFFIQMRVVVSRIKWRRLGKVTEYRLLKSGKVGKFRGHFQVKNLLWVVMIWVF